MSWHRGLLCQNVRVLTISCFDSHFWLLFWPGIDDGLNHRQPDEYNPFSDSFDMYVLIQDVSYSNHGWCSLALRWTQDNWLACSLLLTLLTPVIVIGSAVQTPILIPDNSLCNYPSASLGLYWYFSCLAWHFDRSWFWCQPKVWVDPRMT